MLTFIHIGDTHLHPDPAYGADPARNRPSSRLASEALVRAVNAVPFEPDFVLHTGDVAHDPDPAAYPACREVLGHIRWPVYYLAGNHDDRAALQRTMLGAGQSPGGGDLLDPFHYTFSVNGVQIVCLDSTGPAEPPRGFVTQPQLDWLTKLTTAAGDDRPMVVAVHHNMLPVGIPWLDDYMRCTNGDAVHRALLPARHRLRGVFFGHVHQPVDVVRDGILYASCASPWWQLHGWPGQTETRSDVEAGPGFNVVTVTRDQTYVRRCRFAIP